MSAIFHYQQGALHAEQVPVAELTQLYGTPLYVYSATALREAFATYQQALNGVAHRICYSVKANGNLAVLHCLAEAGSGFDVVSSGELTRVLQAGGRADTVVFSGAGKTVAELDAALAADIFCFNVESQQELELLAARAKHAGRCARVALRINPDINANTHSHITTGLARSKFGIPSERALQVVRHAAELEYLEFLGLSCHIGSQMMHLAPLRAALAQILALCDELQSDGIRVQLVNMGGGLGVQYQPDDAPPTPIALGTELSAGIARRDLELVVEPGRSIAAAAGILISRILYCKTTADKQQLAVADAGMNDLLRPALYGDWHPIMPVLKTTTEQALPLVDIVGPVCESADVLGYQRPLKLGSDALIAIGMAGAYGASMASNYNGRPRPAEVLVSGSSHHLARRRETQAELMRGESVAPGEPPL